MSAVMQPGLFSHGPAEAMYDRGAVLSPDGVYRYRLWRIWDQDRAPTAFVMLNPSTADASIDDPTIRRCVGFARSWGAGGVVVVNLYAFRATDPADLLAAEARGVDVIGPDNDAHIRTVFSAVDGVVFAWGATPVGPGVARRVRDALPPGVEVSCLGVTKHGHPRHPLYLAANTARVPLTDGGRRG